jgi:hypothetical protein
MYYSPLLLVFQMQRCAVVSLSVLRRPCGLGQICGCGIRSSSNGLIVFGASLSHEVTRNMMAGGYTRRVFGAPTSKKRTRPQLVSSDGLYAIESCYAMKYRPCSTYQSL